MKARRLAWFWALSILSSSSAFAADITVPVPCDPNSPAGSQTGFLRSCADLIPEVEKELDARLLQHSKNFHTNGMSGNPSSGVDYTGVFGAGGNRDLASFNAQDSGKSFGVPVCSVTANPLTNNVAEVTSNMVGQSCKDPQTLNVHITPIIGRKRFRPYLKATITNVTWSNNGEREGAYVRGLLVQAMACYSAQVKNEIEKQKLLRISSNSIKDPNAAITPGCSSVAHDIVSMGKESQALAANLREQLGNQKNAAELFKCSGYLNNQNGYDTSGATTGMDTGQIRQSAVLLCAARTATETMFKQLMACEVFNRAGIDYQSFMNNQDQLFAELRAGPGQACRSQCYNQCRGCSGTGDCDSCATNCSNQCYGNQLVAFFQNKAKRWPNDGSCQNALAESIADSSGETFLKKLMEVAVHE